MRPRGQTFNAAIHELSTPLIHVFLISRSNHGLIYSLALITFEYEVEGGRGSGPVRLERTQVHWLSRNSECLGSGRCAWSGAERLVGGGIHGRKAQVPSQLLSCSIGTMDVTRQRQRLVLPTNSTVAVESLTSHRANKCASRRGCKRQSAARGKDEDFSSLRHGAAGKVHRLAARRPRQPVLLKLPHK